MDEIRYKVRLSSRPEREAIVRASRDASTQVEDFYEFRNQKTSLKVIRIDIHLPIYRTENFRTFTDQKEYTLREGKPTNYFQAGLENETVQQLQHNILSKLARTGRVDSIVPVIDVLKKEGQRERLLITSAGVVVNGNRRLAAMRELSCEPSASASFSHVDCMVLPEDTLPEDVVDIEASLQAKPEVKLKYDWIGDCKLINRMRELGKTTRQIAERLNRKEREIINSLQALAEADLYLKGWAGAEGQYSRVQDAEQLFKDLPSLLEGKDAQLADASRAIAWSLYDSREELGTRLYAFNSAIGKGATEVLDRVSSELGIPLESTASSGEQDGDFAIDLEADESTLSYGGVIEALMDPQRREEVTDVLIEASRGVVESEKGRKSASAALKAVTQAHAKLAEIDLSRADRGTYDGIDKQLDGILKKATDLKSKLTLYRSGEHQEQQGADSH